MSLHLVSDRSVSPRLGRIFEAMLSSAAKSCKLSRGSLREADTLPMALLLMAEIR